MLETMSEVAGQLALALRFLLVVVAWATILALACVFGVRKLVGYLKPRPLT